MTKLHFPAVSDKYSLPVAVHKDSDLHTLLRTSRLVPFTFRLKERCSLDHLTCHLTVGQLCL